MSSFEMPPEISEALHNSPEQGGPPFSSDAPVPHHEEHADHNPIFSPVSNLDNASNDESSQLQLGFEEIVYLLNELVREHRCEPKLRFVIDKLERLRKRDEFKTKCIEALQLTVQRAVEQGGKVEKELRDTESKLQNAFHSHEDAATIIENLHGDVVSVNKQLEAEMHCSSLLRTQLQPMMEKVNVLEDNNKKLQVEYQSLQLSASRAYNEVEMLKLQAKNAGSGSQLNTNRRNFNSNWRARNGPNHTSPDDGAQQRLFQPAHGQITNGQPALPLAAYAGTQQQHYNTSGIGSPGLSSPAPVRFMQNSFRQLNPVYDGIEGGPSNGHFQSTSGRGTRSDACDLSGRYQDDTSNARGSLGADQAGPSNGHSLFVSGQTGAPNACDHQANGQAGPMLTLDRLWTGLARPPNTSYGQPTQFQPDFAPINAACGLSGAHKGPPPGLGGLSTSTQAGAHLPIRQLVATSRPDYAEPGPSSARIRPIAPIGEKVHVWRQNGQTGGRPN